MNPLICNVIVSSNGGVMNLGGHKIKKLILINFNNKYIFYIIKIMKIIFIVKNGQIKISI